MLYYFIGREVGNGDEWDGSIRGGNLIKKCIHSTHVDILPDLLGPDSCNICLKYQLLATAGITVFL